MTMTYDLLLMMTLCDMTLTSTRTPLVVLLLFLLILFSCSQVTAGDQILLDSSVTRGDQILCWGGEDLHREGGDTGAGLELQSLQIFLFVILEIFFF